MNKKNIVLITSAFPYEPGEQFLETEIIYWAKTNDVNLIIMPCSKSKTKREIASKIDINHQLINKWTIAQFVKYFFKTVKSSLLYRELFLIRNKLYILPLSIRSIMKILRYRDILENYIINNKNKDYIFYIYWNNEVTYALQILKKKYDIKLISRIHGHDLYEERRKFNYMPLKRQFTNYINKIYTITDSAKEYLIDKYGFDRKIIETSRLGVNNLNIKTLPSESNKLIIVSCSYLVPVKRIDKLFISIDKFSKKYHNIQIEWVHIGDGPLKRDFIQRINELNERNNLLIRFVGELKNKEVYEYYKKNNIDVFINVSESEGVPVSIMEAMSCHIPIIAPNVGGISDMIIDKYNGILLSKNADISEIINALEKIDFFKDKKTRENSYEIFIKRYNAEINYSDFINKVKFLKDGKS